MSKPLREMGKIDIENRNAQFPNGAGPSGKRSRKIRGGRRPLIAFNEQSLKKGLSGKPAAAPTPAKTKEFSKPTKPATGTLCSDITPTRDTSYAQTFQTTHRDKRCRSKRLGNNHSGKYWGVQASSTAAIAVALAFSVASQIEPNVFLFSVCCHIAVWVAFHLNSANDNKRFVDINEKTDVVDTHMTAVGNELAAVNELLDDFRKWHADFRKRFDNNEKLLDDTEKRLDETTKQLDDARKQLDANHKVRSSEEEELTSVKGVLATMAAEEEQTKAWLSSILQLLP